MPGDVVAAECPPGGTRLSFSRLARERADELVICVSGLLVGQQACWLASIDWQRIGGDHVKLLDGRGWLRISGEDVVEARRSTTGKAVVLGFFPDQPVPC